MKKINKWNGVSCLCFNESDAKLLRSNANDRFRYQPYRHQRRLTFHHDRGRRGRCISCGQEQ